MLRPRTGTRPRWWWYDGSTDESREVAAAIPGIRCLAQSHAGPPAARNTGVEVSSGKFLAFSTPTT